jgi:uncharacterized protein (DUF58 family)
MEKVRLIELRTRGLVNSAFAGNYHSAIRGRGLEFDRVREYIPGDEIRTIDWNVTARTGRPFVKEFHEERELSLLLVIDVSASGEFGSTSWSKRELAAELACVLAMSAIRNNDQVGLILFSDRIECMVPPAKGRAHALRVVREILDCQPQGRGTDIAAALEQASRILRRRSLVFLISDLEVGNDRVAALRAIEAAAPSLGGRHDAVALHIADPHERALPDVGLVSLEDAESGEVIQIDTGRRKVRERFARLAAERLAETQQLLRRAGFEQLEVDTAKSYVPVLLEFFFRRERRLR